MRTRPQPTAPCSALNCVLSRFSTYQHILPVQSAISLGLGGQALSHHDRNQFWAIAAEPAQEIELCMGEWADAVKRRSEEANIARQQWSRAGQKVGFLLPYGGRATVQEPCWTWAGSAIAPRNKVIHSQNHPSVHFLLTPA